MDNRTQLEIETYELWNSFKDEVYHKNRFFITHPLLEILKKYISEHTLNIKINTIYYRVRIIDEKVLKDHFLKNALICLCYTSKIKNPCKLCFTGIFYFAILSSGETGND